MAFTGADGREWLVYETSTRGEAISAAAEWAANNQERLHAVCIDYGFGPRPYTGKTLTVWGVMTPEQLKAFGRRVRDGDAWTVVTRLVTCDNSQRL